MKPLKQLATLVFLVISWLPCNALAEVPPACRLREPTPISETQFQYQPKYFAKALPDRPYAGIMLDDGTYLLNLKSGELTQIPGTWDAVPTPDGKMVTTIQNEKSMRWLLSSELIDHPPKGGAIHTPSYKAENYDERWKYQSIGELPSSKPLDKHYRLLVDNDSGSIYIRDENFLFSHKNDENPNYESGPWTQLCTNVQSTLKLPMISKNGKRASFFNVQKQRTEIYDIADNGSCKLKQPLPFATGKADFSFDGNQVAFHLTNARPNHAEAEWWKHPNVEARQNIFVLDLTSKKLTRITNKLDANSFFPTFRKDGTIGFLRESYGAPYGPDKPKFSYIIADPKQGLSQVLASEKAECLNQYAADVGIGTLWAELCGHLKKDLALDTYATIPLSLNGEDCQKMVTENWQKFQAQVLRDADKAGDASQFKNREVLKALKELPLEAVVGACQNEKMESTSPAKQMVVNSTQKLEIDKSKVLVQTCGECHSGQMRAGRPDLDFNKAAEFTDEQKAQMIELIKSGQMPPGGRLKGGEKADLIRLLGGTK